MSSCLCCLCWPLYKMKFSIVHRYSFLWIVIKINKFLLDKAFHSCVYCQVHPGHGSLHPDGLVQRHTRGLRPHHLLQPGLGPSDRQVLRLWLRARGQQGEAVSRWSVNRSNDMILRSGMWCTGQGPRAPPVPGAQPAQADTRASAPGQDWTSLTIIPWKEEERLVPGRKPWMENYFSL